MTSPAHALAEGLAGDGPATADLVDAATRAIAAATAAWPDLPPPDAGFVAFARDRLPEAAQLAARLPDLLLAHHLAAGHPAAVAALGRILDGLRAPLRRTGADAAMIEELIADLPGDLIAPRDGGAPRIHGYAGRGPLAGWVRVIAVRTLVERRRKAGAAPDDDDAVADAATPELDPELDLLRQTYRAEFRRAFAAAVAELDPADRVLLRQHHLDGVGLDALARLHGVHRATAARRLAAARDAIFTRARRRLLGELRVGGDTVDSIIRLVRSELDLSLERYL